MHLVLHTYVQQPEATFPSTKKDTTTLNFPTATLVSHSTSKQQLTSNKHGNTRPKSATNRHPIYHSHDLLHPHHPLRRGGVGPPAANAVHQRLAPRQVRQPEYAPTILDHRLNIVAHPLGDRHNVRHPRPHRLMATRRAYKMAQRSECFHSLTAY